MNWFGKKSPPSPAPNFQIEEEPEHPREGALRRYWQEIDRLKAVDIATGS